MKKVFRIFLYIFAVMITLVGLPLIMIERIGQLLFLLLAWAQYRLILPLGFTYEGLDSLFKNGIMDVLKFKDLSKMYIDGRDFLIKK